ncbi:unnamed protein product [Ixodes pacificus]
MSDFIPCHKARAERCDDSASNKIKMFLDNPVITLARALCEPPKTQQALMACMLSKQLANKPIILHAAWFGVNHYIKLRETLDPPVASRKVSKSRTPAGDKTKNYEMIFYQVLGSTSQLALISHQPPFWWLPAENVLSQTTQAKTVLHASLVYLQIFERGSILSGSLKIER